MEVVARNSHLLAEVKGFDLVRIRATFDTILFPDLVPPGTGKTTSILALAHELLVPNYKETVLELNASDDRNIERLIQMSQVNHGVKSPVDISMDITRLIQTLNMSTTAFRDGVKLTLEAELASTS
uniref:Uncharacterized protein LOC104234807 n=1 Tax=Nicotiana sylvestris TaxID=4096 RepID=A0A1U7XAR3_NICSY|nr:PREDICTED: uncharacterized protein LOC104234807 [Nicotiana sylvestris]